MSHKITFCKALNEAITQEMECDERVFIYGIGVPDHKKVFRSTEGILERFGPKRCFDTPLCEDTMLGFGLGAAIGGLRPIHVHMRLDFMLLAMNQLVNMVSSYSYLTGLKVPFVIRAIVGRGWGQGSQHSKSLHSYFSHIPGLKVVLPTTPRDAKGLLTAAIRDDDPVVFIEHRWLYYAEEEVPEGEFVLPIGEGNILREGTDVTIVGTSWMNIEALRAADILERHHNIYAEVIDPRTIAPLNNDLIFESVMKTGRCVVVDNDWLDCGFGAEVSARINEQLFGRLASPVVRIGWAQTPCPTVRVLENEFYPNAKTIVRAVEKMLDLEAANLEKELVYSHQEKFKGPF
jgi:pyruvate/2-oxoglutarate/acetoin dehydrogenase E1 component